eukprot:Gb_30355 [translate_table: standard]
MKLCQPDKEKKVALAQILLGDCTDPRSCGEEDEASADVEMLFNKRCANERLATEQFENRSVLHEACINGETRLCELLLRFGATVDPDAMIYALNGNYEKILDLLIYYDSGNSVDSEGRYGKSPMEEATLPLIPKVGIVKKLLSVSKQQEAYFHKLARPEVLHESIRRHHIDLMKKLLDRGVSPLDQDSDGKTALHHAVECEDQDRVEEMVDALLEKREGRDALAVCDKYGRTPLHVAVILGNKSLCDNILSRNAKLADIKDPDGQSCLYYAVAGGDAKVVDLFLPRSLEQDMRDCSGRTPLHIAAASGNKKLVKQLLSECVSPENYVKRADFLGQTALHKAAIEGHKETVKTLLDNGARPLAERDCDGKTALHYVVQLKNEKVAIEIAKLLLNKCESDEEKSLLLWASAAGIGTAEEILRKGELKNFLLDKKWKTTMKMDTNCNLVKTAAKLGNIAKTQELLARGGKIADIDNSKWKSSLTKKQQENVHKVLEYMEHMERIDKIAENRTDQPALTDNLGRSDFANGLAALFLNPYVKSPIAVGILGEWGMGKSSLMAQVHFHPFYAE